MGKRVRLSSEKLNCCGTWIKSDGIDLTQYNRNPILLYMHERGKVIGSVTNIQLAGEELTGELEFDGVREESKIAKEQFEKGTLRMVSVNVDVTETSNDIKLMKPGQRRATVTKCRLCEVSVVDYGGNDDAIVLSYEGKELKLSAGEQSPHLPLINEQLKKEESMFKQIALAMGLPETATEAEILSAITLSKQAHDSLRLQVDNLQLAGITGAVEAAIAAKKITADKKEHFVGLGKTIGIESLQLTFDSMNGSMKPTDVLGVGTNLPLSGGKKYAKLSEVPDAELLEMRENDKENYRLLYKAEYGIECVI